METGELQQPYMGQIQPLLDCQELDPSGSIRVAQDMEQTRNDSIS